jgi:hypothetical protein
MFKHIGIISGKRVIEFDVFKPNNDVEQTQECVKLWKENYTLENGAFGIKFLK